MITKKTVVGIQLFFFIFVASMASIAMADTEECCPPDCVQEKVCPLLDSAYDNLDAAHDYIEAFGMINRTRGRAALVKAYIDITGAQTQMLKCHILDIPITDLIAMTPADLQELIDLIISLPDLIPAMAPMLQPIIESGVETIKVETVLLIVKTAIVHAEIETIGMHDWDALDNIFYAQKILEKLSSMICD